jgi:hypothetical protein
MLKLLVETGRIATASKVADSKFLNVLGLKVFRTVLGGTIYSMRRFPIPAELWDQVLNLRREGIIAIPGFLQEARFVALKEECL